MEICARPALRAFTLVEMLVVIAILVVLVGLVVPAARSVRDTAQAMRCQGKQRQIGLGTLGYSGDWNGAILKLDPWGANVDPYGDTGCNNNHWLLALIKDGHLGEEAPNLRYWDHRLSSLGNADLRCEAIGQQWRGMSGGAHYEMSVYLSNWYNWGAGSRISRMASVSGASRTVHIVEHNFADPNQLKWGSWPGSFVWWNGRGLATVAYPHRGGGAVLFLDGRVERLRREQLTPAGAINHATAIASASGDAKWNPVEP